MGVQPALGDRDALRTITTTMSPSVNPVNSMPDYPPAAHKSSKDLVSEQPLSASTMSVSPKTSGELYTQDDQSEQPLRLRGGCIPCPVSSFLGYGVNSNSDVCCRMGAYVGSFLFHAAVEHCLRATKTEKCEEARRRWCW